MMRLALCALALAAAAHAAEDPFYVKFNVALTGTTKKGRTKPETDAAFVVRVEPEWAPKGVAQFREIIEAGVWNEARFFRVVPGFVVQWGIPGEPAAAEEWRAKRIKDDNLKPGVSNKKGMITFAKAGPNTRTSQVFINLNDNTNLDRMGFPPFGEVVEGMGVVEQINTEYREKPNQGEIQKQGNAYLTKEFPNLSYIKSAEIVAWGDAASREGGATEL